jgi:hypothetical protein
MRLLIICPTPQKLNLNRKMDLEGHETGGLPLLTPKNPCGLWHSKSWMIAMVH